MTACASWRHWRTMDSLEPDSSATTRRRGLRHHHRARAHRLRRTRRRRAARADPRTAGRCRPREVPGADAGGSAYHGPIEEAEVEIFEAAPARAAQAAGREEGPATLPPVFEALTMPTVSRTSPAAFPAQIALTAVWVIVHRHRKSRARPGARDRPTQFHRDKESTMSTAALKAEQDVLSAGPDALLQRASDAVASADRVLQAAKAGVRAKVRGGRRHRCGPACRARARLACDHGRGAAPDARLGRPACGRGPLRRVRAADPRCRIRRVPGADRRRHPHEPGGDHPPRGARRRQGRGSPLRGRGRRSRRRGQHPDRQVAACRSHRRPARRHHLRRHRPRRDARGDPRADAQVL